MDWINFSFGFGAGLIFCLLMKYLSDLYDEITGKSQIKKFKENQEENKEEDTYESELEDQEGDN